MRRQTGGSMRQIGTIPDIAQAERFEDHLLTLGVKSKFETDTDGWAVWILDEDQLTQARKALATFLENPDDARYAQSNQTASQLRKQSEKKARKAQKQHVNVRDSWNKPFARRCPVTFAMIIISVAVAIFSSETKGLSNFRLATREMPLLTYFRIAPTQVNGGKVRWNKEAGLQSVRQGQVWRLVTPIFIHFGFLHILFNMLWLRQLGTAIEFHRGSLRLVLMCLLIAVTSNFSQYMVIRDPGFGGMSGVVFGLFGYIWMKSRFDYNSGFHIPPNTVFWMIAWFAICFTGYVGQIANTAHSVGLGVGVMLGYLPKAFTDWSREVKS